MTSGDETEIPGREIETSSWKSPVPWNSLSWPKTSIVEAELVIIDMLDEADADTLIRRLESSGEKLSSVIARYVHLGLASDAEQDQEGHARGRSL